MSQARFGLQVAHFCCRLHRGPEDTKFSICLISDDAIFGDCTDTVECNHPKLSQNVIVHAKARFWNSHVMKFNKKFTLWSKNEF